MEIKHTDFNRDTLNQRMHLYEKGQTKVKMGHVIIPTGARFPATASKSNPEEEFSYLVKGKLIGEIEDQAFTMTAGDFIHIPAGHQQWCQNVGDEEVYIVYTLVE
ncbi:cupin domain-containing protein [Fundicoccus culcitae]|uniref:Cupin domain-containing protein n=1 Tax=Fundicoccus culcitae TaxID=2969821 RepID=A0ABY5P440_9LACT|nr:cupin domain-containing protein [Fundicoccus culcitae]UUX33314.1 cupin domain-containing protein [Fundicoccus culcitae]